MSCSAVAIAIGSPMRSPAANSSSAEDWRVPVPLAPSNVDGDGCNAAPPGAGDDDRDDWTAMTDDHETVANDGDGPEGAIGEADIERLRAVLRADRPDPVDELTRRRVVAAALRGSEQARDLTSDTAVHAPTVQTIAPSRRRSFRPFAAVAAIAAAILAVVGIATTLDEDDEPQLASVDAATVVASWHGEAGALDRDGVVAFFAAVGSEPEPGPPSGLQQCVGQVLDGRRLGDTAGLDYGDPVVTAFAIEVTDDARSIILVVARDDCRLLDRFAG